mgnify:CR=1 FL=1|jgi:hypothetical protein
MPKDAAVTLRIPLPLKARLDALLPRLAADPRYQGFPNVSRATLYRMALDRGAAELNHELPPLPEVASEEVSR